VATLGKARRLLVGDRPVHRVYAGSALVWDAATVAGAAATSSATTSGCTVDGVVYDQYGAPLRPDAKFPGWGGHEASLGGVNPGFDWAVGARPGPRPHDATNPGFEGVTYTHHNVWGQVVAARGGSPERRVRVHVELPRVYHLASGASSWVQVRGTAADVKNFEGGYWSGPSYSKVRSMVAGQDFRSEAGGSSWDARPLTAEDGSPSATPVGHWYYSGFYPRLPIPQGGHVAIYTRMRLISDVPGVDVGTARFLGAFSGDLYTSATATVGTNGRNPPLAITRHKLLGPQWRTFTYVSGTATEIRALPRLPFVTG
jgi:hypothetical protein